MRDAEALFLIHDDETEIVKLNGLVQKPVRTDDHVDAAVSQSAQRLRCVGGRLSDAI